MTRTPWERYVARRLLLEPKFRAAFELERAALMKRLAMRKKKPGRKRKS